MDLSVLLPLADEITEYQALLLALRLGHAADVRAQVIDAAKPYLLASLRRDLGRPILVVTGRTDKAQELYNELTSWSGGETGLYLFPEFDALPYERLSPDLATVKQRLRTLLALSQNGKGTPAPLIVTSSHALASKTIVKSEFVSSVHTVNAGTKVNRDDLIARWLSLGYEMDKAVEVPGTMSRRGGILDIFPPSSELPVRIEFFGDEIESIRFFDPATQRSQARIGSVSIIPAREMLAPAGLSATEALGQLDFSKGQPESRQKFADELGRLLGGDHFFGMEFYAGMFDRGSLLDYLPQDALVIVDEPKQLQESVETMDAQADEMRRAQVDRGELPSDFPAPYLKWPELAEKLSAVSSRLSLAEWEMESQASFDFAAAPGYSGRVEGFIREAPKLLESGRRVVVVSQQASRLSEMLQDQDIFASPMSDLSEAPSPGHMALVHGSLAAGWQSQGAALTVLTDTEIFGFVKQRRLARRRPVRHEEFLAEIAAGDYVVHIEHGIARFVGATTMRSGDEEREYLVLEYASGDKLYVPTDQVDRVTRYVGPGGYTPTLTRLGTQEWTRAKQKAKEATIKLARELLALYASRETLAGFAFSLDSVWQHEMESAFPFVETPDQLTAVQQVKQDMEKPRPMDRLVCGDVGYGKTEVALRAAFKAVMDGKQVAILVPTTVLAQQHFNTFTQRLSPFPVRVEALSRLRSPKEQHEVLEGVKNGAVDMVIGTHRLLQKDVAFKDLGMVIIDEEQRFGVAHKERLKQMRKEVDVLTLTATPIPRTLHMALVNIRDMSTIETPPEERLPIKTYVAEYEDRLVREAILRELDRGGQVFFVHNRVRTIPWIANRLRELVPQARISVGHGQMPDEDLEEVMLEFSKGNADVLVCSTIIESGLDLPNVNTLIVNDAHRLGLTQLYQLRGRVGRGSNRAYAYFLYPKGRKLTDTARQRLKTIFEATELGAGFRIALKDLEIRGAGNILGPEQSGQIGAVGFTFYTKMLAEAVKDLKAGAVPGRAPGAPAAPIIALKLSARLPEDYVADLSARLALYQRLAATGSVQQVADLAQELEDRFGKMPPEVENLLYIVKVRCLGALAGVSGINEQDGEVVVQMAEGKPIRRLPLLKIPLDGLKIGVSQMRLDEKRLGDKWQSRLMEILEAMAGVTGSPQPR